MHYSIVEYFGDSKGNKCGYCKSSNTSVSHGMWAHLMTVEDYQSLMDRGWRRSGLYVYKPTMKETCCPQYTIKCNVMKFKISKSQKKVLKRMSKFLKTGQRKEPNEDVGNQQNMESQDIPCDHLQSRSDIKPVHNIVQDVIKINMQEDVNQSVSGSSQNIDAPKCVGQDPNKPAPRKAKLIRKELHKAKQQKNVNEASNLFNHNAAKTIEEFLAEEVHEDAKHKLTTRIVRSYPASSEFNNTLTASASVYQKYQMTIHGDALTKCDQKQFVRFLVSSPLKATTAENLLESFGSFHQQFWLDDKLIAVSVLDILPHAVSSVYFYYDPDYSFLSLGTYSALREIALVREINKSFNRNLHYYMGFYIHSCPKMKYKGNYTPSFLLCPETYKWMPINECISKLDINKYSRLHPDENADDEDRCDDVSNILVLYNHRPMTFSTYCRRTEKSASNDIKQYASLIGQRLTQRILIYRE